jgi:hypothetical protein
MAAHEKSCQDPETFLEGEILSKIQINLKSVQPPQTDYNNFQ